MDDFEYSVHISEQDWDSFFLECEECNLLPPVLAGVEDSGMSDMDEIASRRSRANTDSTVSESELQASDPERDGSPVDLYLNKYGLSSPIQLLSGSEEDLHMEAVNVFFEQLKSVSASEDSLMQKHSSDMGNKMADHLEGSVKEESAKEMTVSVETQPKKNRFIQRNEPMQKDDSYTYRYNRPTANELTHASTHPNPELAGKEERSPWDAKKEGMQCDLCKELKSGTEKIPCYNIVNGKTLIGSNQEKKANSQLVTIGDSGSKVLLDSQGQPSSVTPRRKRRKKKRISTEPVEVEDHGLEAKQSESDDDLFVRRKEMDREMCPSGNCTASEAHHILSPPPQIESIEENLQLHPQCLLGNAVGPTVEYSNSPRPCQETQCPTNAAQNRRTSEFMHEKSDLTEKPPSTVQFAKTVNLTSTETDVPVKMTDPLIIDRNDSTSTPTNGDNVESHLQPNGNLPSENTSAPLAPKPLPSTITCGDIEIVSQTIKPKSTENLLLLSSKDMKKDLESSILHHTGNSYVNSATLPPAALLPQTDSSLYVLSQEKFREIVTLSELQCDRCGAVCQRKTSASANISCVTFPEIAQEMPSSRFCNNAEKKPDLNSVTHKDILTEHKNTHDFPDKKTLVGTFDSKLVTLTDPVNIDKAQVGLQKAQINQMQVKREVSEDDAISNKSLNGKLPSHQSEDWTEEILLTIKSNNKGSLPASKKHTQLKETPPPASENRNEGLSITDISRMCLESQLKENLTSFKTTATGEEENFEVCQVTPRKCSLKGPELSLNTVMQSMVSSISASVEGAKSLDNDNGSEDWTEDSTSSLRSNEITNLPGKKKGIHWKEEAILTSEDRNEHPSSKELKKHQTFGQIGVPEIPPNGDMKDEVCSMSCHYPSKDDEMLPTIKTQSPAYSTPESIYGEEHSSSTVITASDEEKEKVQNVLPNFPSGNHELSPCETMDETRGLEHENGKHIQSENSAEEVFPYITSRIITYLPGNGINVKTAEVQSSADQDKNDGLSTRGQPIIQITGSENQLGQDSKSENISSHHIGTTRDEKKGKVLLKDNNTAHTPQSMDGAEYPSSNIIDTGREEKGIVQSAQFPPEDLEYSPTAVLQSMDSSPAQLMDGAELTSSNAIATDKEENGSVQNILPQCPPKDLEYSPTAVLQSMDSPTPLSMDGVKHTSSNIIIITNNEDKPLHCITPSNIIDTGREEKGIVQSAQFPPEDLEFSSSAVLQSMASPTPQSIDGAEPISSNIINSSEEDKRNVQNITPYFPPKDLEYSHTSVLQSMDSSPAQLMDEAELTSSNAIATDKEENGSVQNILPQCPPKDLEYSPTAVLQSMDSPSPQSMDGAERNSSNTATGEEEKGNVENVPPQFPDKDLEISCSAVLQSFTSPTPLSMDGSQFTSSHITPACEEEKGGVQNVPPQFQKFSPSVVMQSMALPTPQSMDGAEHISSNTATGEEEKGKVENVPPQFPDKDFEFACSEVMQSMASPTPRSTDGAKQTSSNIIITDNEEKRKLHCITTQFPSKDLEISPSAVMQSMASPTPQSMDGAERNSSNTATGEEEKGKVENVPLQFQEFSPSAVKQSMASPTPQSIDGAEPISSNIINRSKEDKRNVQNITPYFPPKGLKYSPTAVLQSMDSSPAQLMDGAELTSSNDIATDKEENGSVQNILPQFPSKDLEISPSAVLQSMDSPTPQSMDEEERNSSNTATGEEEKGNVENVPPQFPDKDLEISCSAVLQSFTSPTPLSMDGSQFTSSHITPACEEEKGGVQNVPLQFQEFSPSVVMQSMALPTPQSMDGAEHISSNTATGEEEKGKVENVPPQFPDKDFEFACSEVMQSMASPTPRSTDGAKHMSSNIITIEEEEKGNVQHFPPHFPPKELEYQEFLPSVEMQSMASPTSQSMDGAEHTSSNIATGEEGKGNVENVPLQFPDKDLEFSSGAVTQHFPTHFPPKELEYQEFLSSVEHTSSNIDTGKDLEISSAAVMQSIDSLTPQSTDGAKHTSSNIITIEEEEKGNVQHFPTHFPPKELEYQEFLSSVEHTSSNIDTVEDLEISSAAVMQSMDSLTPQSTDGAKHTSSNITTPDNEEKRKLHCVPYQFSPKENELSRDEIIEGMSSTTPESMDGAKSLETVDTPSPPPHPVYTISSFWNEMEKLTINDILRLRLVGQAQHPGLLLQPEDTGISDILDAADSGYFTHLDDSKPDRSSGDMSFISDFDEELSQLQTQEAAKLNDESRDSPNSGDMMWESDLDPSGTRTGLEDVFMLSSETALPPPLNSDNAPECFRKMCKNISVQDLNALETRKILRNASLLSIQSVHSTHSIHPDVEDDYVDPFDRVDSSSPVFQSDEEEETESITFSEIIQYFFGGDEPDHSSSAADNITPSYLGTGTSVPETYDHFFSEFEPSSLFYPLAEDTSSGKDELVPIFSCSRSNKSLQFPEVYDYFFPDDSPITSDEDEEHNPTVIQVVTRYDHMSASDPHEQRCPDNSWSFLRNNPLSFRRVRRAGFTAPPEKNSLALTPVKNSRKSFWRGIQPINAMGCDEKPFPDPLLLSLENRIFRQLANQQNIRSEMQTAVADPRVDAALMPLKQADMCLVCIAFASWVLKSVNPQGADMWKAALLANISALSAIRYLRRCKRDEATRKTPLCQIEPA